MAVDGESNPKVREFLRERLDGMMGNRRGVLYLYYMDQVAAGQVSTAEVYRFPAGRSPGTVARQVITQTYKRAGFHVVRGSEELSVGKALTFSITIDRDPISVFNKVYVATVGTTVVAVSVSHTLSHQEIESTVEQPLPPEIHRMLNSLRPSGDQVFA